MTTFRLVIGDEYADGHGMYDEIHVEVLGRNGDDLRANFEVNKKELNFDPKYLAENYEEYKTTRTVLAPLFEDGFEFKNHTSIIDPDDEDIYLESEMLVDVLMYLYGRGLGNFSWRIVEKPEKLNQESYGYGLFML